MVGEEVWRAGAEEVGMDFSPAGVFLLWQEGLPSYPIIGRSNWDWGG
jgi:hypothetical protein